MAEFYPTCRYHPTEAPKGRKFTNAAEFNALNEDWVDTPTKLPPVVSLEPETRGDIAETPAPVRPTRARK